MTKLTVAFRNFAKSPKKGSQDLFIGNDYVTPHGVADKQATMDNGEYQII